MSYTPRTDNGRQRTRRACDRLSERELETAKRELAAAQEELARVRESLELHKQLACTLTQRAEQAETQLIRILAERAADARELKRAEAERDSLREDRDSLSAALVQYEALEAKLKVERDALKGDFTKLVIRSTIKVQKDIMQRSFSLAHFDGAEMLKDEILSAIAARSAT